MKKKLFAVLLSIVMVAGLLPTVAFATENYNLYVNGEQFTSEKLSICLLYTSSPAVDGMHALDINQPDFRRVRYRMNTILLHRTVSSRCV